MTMGAELLAHGMAHEVEQLDEKFYLEVFQPTRPRAGVEEESEGLKMAVEVTNQPLPVVRVGEIPREENAAALACRSSCGATRRSV